MNRRELIHRLQMGDTILCEPTVGRISGAQNLYRLKKADIYVTPRMVRKLVGQGKLTFMTPPQGNNYYKWDEESFSQYPQRVRGDTHNV